MKPQDTVNALKVLALQGQKWTQNGLATAFAAPEIGRSARCQRGNVLMGCNVKVAW